MLTTETFQAELNRLNAHTPESRFLLAVSGGPDSMVLLHLFQRLDAEFQVAHVNYKLRGEDSDADEQLVREYCHENNIKFHLYSVSEKDKKPEGSVQLWARELRYRFFRKTQEAESLQYLITAHHLNDQLETFIINLSRGTGIRGLCVIPARTEDTLRPLLHFSKEDIYKFAHENNIRFREDLSNRKNDYLRNRIRNEITPKLMETNPQFLDHFDKSIAYLNQANDFVDEKIAEIEQGLIQESSTGFIINKAGLLQESPFVKFEILRKFRFAEEKEISKIFAAEKGKIFRSPTFELTVDREMLILRPLNERAAAGTEEVILKTVDDHIMIPEAFKALFIKHSSLVWHFDREKLTLPLKLRKQKDGDVFYPIGMIGKKKISKFYKDEKLPILAAQEIWLLCDSNDEVLAVIPLRQDRRYAASEDTRHFLTLNF